MLTRRCHELKVNRAAKWSNAAVSLLLGVAIVAVSPGTISAAWFRGLGQFNSEFRLSDPSVIEVSRDGSTAVGIRDFWPFTSHAPYRWTRQSEQAEWLSATTPSTPVNTHEIVTSADGRVVFTTPWGMNRFRSLMRWTPEAGGREIDFPAEVPQGPEVVFRLGGVSADGETLFGAFNRWSTFPGCGTCNFPLGDAFLWSEETGFTMLESGAVTELYGISADGRTAYALSDQGDVVRWHEGEFSVLYPNVPQAIRDSAFAVDNGSFTYARDARLYRWDVDNGERPLGSFSRSYGMPTVANATGTVVLYSNGDHRGMYIWDADHGTRDLGSIVQDELQLAPGWFFNHAFHPDESPEHGNVRGVSDDGLTYVGSAIPPGATSRYHPREHWIAFIGAGQTLGDADDDGDVDLVDVNLVREHLGSAGPMGSPGDVDNGGTVDEADLENAIQHYGDIAPGFSDKAFTRTWYGDANLDGEFRSDDLTQLFQAGLYEDGIIGNARWSSGDWNGDGDFTASDLVLAFADGGYDRGPRLAVKAVPEPLSNVLLLIMGAAGFVIQRRRIRRSRDSDWDGDQEFSTADLVYSFQAGGYVI